MNPERADVLAFLKHQLASVHSHEVKGRIEWIIDSIEKGVHENWIEKIRRKEALDALAQMTEDFADEYLPRERL